MKTEREGIDRLKQAIDRVAADLHPKSMPRPKTEMGQGSSTVRQFFSWKAAALVLAFFSLAAVGYLRFFRIPGLEAENRSLREQATAAFGTTAEPAAMLRLTLPPPPKNMRDSQAGSSEAGPGQIELTIGETGARLLMIALDPAWRGVIEEADVRYRFELRERRQGRRVWAGSLTGDRLTRFLNAGEPVPFVMRPASLSSGPVDLKFIRVDLQGETVLATVLLKPAGK